MIRQATEGRYEHGALELRSAPDPHTGIAGMLLLCCLLLLSVGCASPDQDRFEEVNRGVYRVNSEFDQWILKPVTRGYVTVAPSPVETGVSNFFANLIEPWTALNQLLQGKPGLAAADGTRFLVNTTVGIGGLVDAASEMGLEHHQEDLGQTLGVWGLAQGDYFVVPFWGGVTTRSGVGDLIAGLVYPLTFLDAGPTRTGLYVLRAIDLRAQALDAERLLRGDRYVFLRDAYIQRRRFLTSDGESDDPFAGDDF